MIAPDLRLLDRERSLFCSKIRAKRSENSERTRFSLFASAPALLAACGFAARRSKIALAIFASFSTDFRVKDRLLAVYKISRWQKPGARMKSTDTVFRAVFAHDPRYLGWKKPGASLRKLDFTSTTKMHELKPFTVGKGARSLRKL